MCGCHTLHMCVLSLSSSSYSSFLSCFSPLPSASRYLFLLLFPRSFSCSVTKLVHVPNATLLPTTHLALRRISCACEGLKVLGKLLLYTYTHTHTLAPQNCTVCQWRQSNPFNSEFLLGVSSTLKACYNPNVCYNRLLWGSHCEGWHLFHPFTLSFLSFYIFPFLLSYESFIPFVFSFLLLVSYLSHSHYFFPVFISFPPTVSLLAFFLSLTLSVYFAFFWSYFLPVSHSHSSSFSIFFPLLVFVFSFLAFLAVYFL